MKTMMFNEQSVDRKWYLIDAKGRVLGRIATEIARRLRGKHKAQFTPHADVGDYIVVINVDQIRVTGDKALKKRYYRHTGYPGGMKDITFGKQMAKAPEKTLEWAVKGMLPKNPLGRQQFRKLKIYAGPSHPHSAQPLELLDNIG